jgi:hypothetical protein
VHKKPTNEELYKFLDDNKEEIFKWILSKAKYKVGDKVIVIQDGDVDYEGKVVDIFISTTDVGDDIQYLIDEGMESHSWPENLLKPWSKNWDWTEEETATDKAISDRDKNRGDQE